MKIKCTDLWYQYKDSRHFSLTGIDLDHDLDGITAVIGANGSGKTTLLRLLCGLLTPSKGTIEIDSGPSISYLPSTGAVSPELTVKEFFAARNGRIKPFLDQTLIEKLSIHDLLDKKANSLSRGQLQRVRLAACLSREAGLYLLDEPSSGLDISNSIILSDAILEYADTGKAIVLVSHTAEEIETLARSLITLKKGEIDYVGSLPGFVQPNQSLRDAWRAKLSA